MKPAFEDMNLQIPAVTAEPEDYTGEDGLLYLQGSTFQCASV